MLRCIQVSDIIRMLHITFTFCGDSLSNLVPVAIVFLQTSQ